MDRSPEQVAVVADWLARGDTDSKGDRNRPRVWSVDLLLHVLVRVDESAYVLVDEEEFEEIASAGVLSGTEISGARGGLAELVALVESDTLLAILRATAPITARVPPAARELARVPVPGWLRRAPRRGVGTGACRTGPAPPVTAPLVPPHGGRGDAQRDLLPRALILTTLLSKGTGYRPVR